MATRRDRDGRSSKSDTCDVLCSSFNKLRFKKASKHCFYEDYVLLKNQLLLLEYDEEDPSIPSKLFDVTDLLRRYIEDVPKAVQDTVEFVEDIHRKLRFLHESNCRHMQINKRFPLSQELHLLLIRYVELEYEVLYCSHNYTPEYQKKVENRIIYLLLLMLYDPITSNGTETLVKNVTDASAMNALYIMRSVKPEYKKQHSLIENIMIKLLRKLNVLDKVNEMRSKNKTLNLEKLLQVPQVQKISEYLRCRDCRTDDSNPSEDEVEEVVEVVQPVKTEAKYNAEEKVNLSSFACYNVQKKVMTIDLDDEDEDCYMIYFQPEVEKLDKKEKKLVFDGFNVEAPGRTRSNISDRFDSYSQLNKFPTSSICDNKTFKSSCVSSDASVCVVDDDSDSDIEVLCENSLPIVDLVDDSTAESISTTSTRDILGQRSLHIEATDDRLQTATDNTDLEDALLQCDDISDSEIENEDAILNRYIDDVDETEPRQITNDEPRVFSPLVETLPTNQKVIDEYHNHGETSEVENLITAETSKEAVAVLSEINNDGTIIKPCVVEGEGSLNTVPVAVANDLIISEGSEKDTSVISSVSEETDSTVDSTSISLPEANSIAPEAIECVEPADEAVSDAPRQLNETVELSACDNQSLNEEQQPLCDNQLSEPETEIAEDSESLAQKSNSLTATPEQDNLVLDENNCHNQELTELNLEPETTEPSIDMQMFETENADCAVREEECVAHIGLQSEEDVLQTCPSSEDLVIEETVVTEEYEISSNIEVKTSHEETTSESNKSEETRPTDILHHQDVTVHEEVAFASKPSELEEAFPDDSTEVITSIPNEPESETLNSESLPFNEEVEVPCSVNEPNEVEISSESLSDNVLKIKEVEQVNDKDQMVTFSDEVEEPAPVETDSAVVEGAVPPKPNYNNQTSSEGAEELTCSNYLDVLAMVAAERPKMEDAMQTKGRPSKKKGKKGKTEKRTKNLKPLKLQTEESNMVTRRVTRSSAVKKQESTKGASAAREQSKFIPSTFMNLENLITPPPIKVYNFISSTATDNEESLDEPFICLQSCENQPSHLNEVPRDGIFDEDTIEDGISFVNHLKQRTIDSAAVIISIPDSEKEYPGINYDILKQAEEFAKTNLSLSSPEELCKELNLKKAKNNFPDLQQIYSKIEGEFTTDHTIQTTVLPEKDSVATNINEPQNGKEVSVENNYLVEPTIAKHSENDDDISSVTVLNRKCDCTSENTSDYVNTTELLKSCDANLTSTLQSVLNTAIEERSSEPITSDEAKSTLVPPKKNKRRIGFGKTVAQLVPVKKRKNYGKKNIIINKYETKIKESDNCLENKIVEVAVTNKVESTEAILPPEEIQSFSNKSDIDSDTKESTNAVAEESSEIVNKHQIVKDPESDESNVCNTEPIVHNSDNVDTAGPAEESSALIVVENKAEGCVVSENLQEKKRDELQQEIQTEVIEEAQICEPILETEEQTTVGIEPQTNIFTEDFHTVLVAEQPSVFQDDLKSSQLTDEVTEAETTVLQETVTEKQSEVLGNLVNTEKTLQEKASVDTIDEVQPQTDEIKLTEMEQSTEETVIPTSTEITDIMQVWTDDSKVSEDNVLQTSDETQSDVSREIEYSDHEITRTSDNLELSSSSEVSAHEEQDLREMPVLEKEESQSSLPQQKQNLTEDNYPLLVAYEVEAIAEEVVESSVAATELEKLPEPQRLEETLILQASNETSMEIEVSVVKPTEEPNIVDETKTDRIISAVTKKTNSDMTSEAEPNDVRRMSRPVLTKAALKSFQNPYVQLQKLPINFDYKKKIFESRENSKELAKQRSKSQDNNNKRQRHDQRSLSESKHKKKTEYCEKSENEPTLTVPNKEKSSKQKDHHSSRRSSADDTADKDEKKNLASKSKSRESKVEDFRTKTRSSSQRQKEKQENSVQTTKLSRSLSESKIERRHSKSKPSEDATDVKLTKNKDKHKLNKELPLFSVEGDAKITYTDKRRKSEVEKEVPKSDNLILKEKTQSNKPTTKEETIKISQAEESLKASHKDKARSSSSRRSSKGDVKPSVLKAEEEMEIETKNKRRTSSDIKTDAKKTDTKEQKAEAYSGRRHSTRSRSSSSSMNNKRSQDEKEAVTDNKIAKEKSGNLDDSKSKTDKIKEDSHTDLEVTPKTSHNKFSDHQHRSSRRSSKSSDSLSSRGKQDEHKSLDKQEHKKATKDNIKVDSHTPVVDLKNNSGNSVDDLEKQVTIASKSEIIVTKGEDHSKRERRESVRTRSSREKLKDVEQSEEKGSKSGSNQHLLRNENATSKPSKTSRDSEEDRKLRSTDKIRTRNDSRQNQEKISKFDSKQQASNVKKANLPETVTDISLEKPKTKFTSEKPKNKTDLQEKDDLKGKLVCEEQPSENASASVIEFAEELLKPPESDSKSVGKTKSKSRERRSKSVNKEPVSANKLLPAVTVQKENSKEDKTGCTEKIKDKKAGKARKFADKKVESQSVTESPPKDLPKEDAEDKPTDRRRTRKEERCKSVSKDSIPISVSETAKINSVDTDINASEGRTKITFDDHGSEAEKNENSVLEPLSTVDSEGFKDVVPCLELLENSQENLKTVFKETKTTAENDKSVCEEQLLETETPTKEISECTEKASKSDSETVPREIPQQEKKKNDLINEELSEEKEKEIAENSNNLETIIENLKTSEDAKPELIDKKREPDSHFEKNLKRKHNREKSDTQQLEEKKSKLRNREEKSKTISAIKDSLKKDRKDKITRHVKTLDQSIPSKLDKEHQSLSKSTNTIKECPENLENDLNIKSRPEKVDDKDNTQQDKEKKSKRNNKEKTVNVESASALEFSENSRKKIISKSDHKKGELQNEMDQTDRKQNKTVTKENDKTIENVEKNLKTRSAYEKQKSRCDESSENEKYKSVNKEKPVDVEYSGTPADVDILQIEELPENLDNLKTLDKSDELKTKSGNSVMEYSATPADVAISQVEELPENLGNLRSTAKSDKSRRRRSDQPEMEYSTPADVDISQVEELPENLYSLKTKDKSEKSRTKSIKSETEYPTTPADVAISQVEELPENLGNLRSTAKSDKSRRRSDQSEMEYSTPADVDISQVEELPENLYSLKTKDKSEKSRTKSIKSEMEYPTTPADVAISQIEEVQENLDNLKTRAKSGKSKSRSANSLMEYSATPADVDISQVEELPENLDKLKTKEKCEKARSDKSDMEYSTTPADVDISQIEELPENLDNLKTKAKFEKTKLRSDNSEMEYSTTPANVVISQIEELPQNCGSLKTKDKSEKARTTSDQSDMRYSATSADVDISQIEELPENLDNLKTKAKSKKSRTGSDKSDMEYSTTLADVDISRIEELPKNVDNLKTKAKSEKSRARSDKSDMESSTTPADVGKSQVEALPEKLGNLNTKGKSDKSKTRSDKSDMEYSTTLADAVISQTEELPENIDNLKSKVKSEKSRIRSDKSDVEYSTTSADVGKSQVKESLEILGNLKTKSKSEKSRTTSDDKSDMEYPTTPADVAKSQVEELPENLDNFKATVKSKKSRTRSDKSDMECSITPADVAKSKVEELPQNVGNLRTKGKSEKSRTASDKSDMEYSTTPADVKSQVEELPENLDNFKTKVKSEKSRRSDKSDMKCSTTPADIAKSHVEVLPENLDNFQTKVQFEKSKTKGDKKVKKQIPKLDNLPFTPTTTVTSLAANESKQILTNESKDLTEKLPDNVAQEKLQEKIISKTNNIAKEDLPEKTGFEVVPQNLNQVSESSAEVFKENDMGNKSVNVSEISGSLEQEAKPNKELSETKCTSMKKKNKAVGELSDNFEDNKKSKLKVIDVQTREENNKSSSRKNTTKSGKMPMEEEIKKSEIQHNEVINDEQPTETKLTSTVERNITLETELNVDVEQSKDLNKQHPLEAQSSSESISDVAATEVLPNLTFNIDKSKHVSNKIEQVKPKHRSSEDICVKTKKPRRFTISELIAEESQSTASGTSTGELNTTKSKETNVEVINDTASIESLKSLTKNVLPRQNKRSVEKQKLKKKDLKCIDSIIENLKNRKSHPEEINSKSTHEGCEAKLIQPNNMHGQFEADSVENMSEPVLKTGSPAELNIAETVKEVTSKINEQAFLSETDCEQIDMGLQKTTQNISECQLSMDISSDTLEQNIADDSWMDETDTSAQDTLKMVDVNVSGLEVIDSSLIEENIPVQEMIEVTDSHKHSERTNMFFTDQENYELMLHENVAAQNSEEKDTHSTYENSPAGQEQFIENLSVHQSIPSSFPEEDNSSLQQIVPLPQAVGGNHLLNEEVCDNIFAYTPETSRTMEDNCLLESNVAFTETVEMSSLPNDLLNLKDTMNSTNSNFAEPVDMASLPNDILSLKDTMNNTNQFSSKKSHSIQNNSTQMIHDLTIPETVTEINQIPITTAQLLGVASKQQREEVIVNLTPSTADASTSCETTDNLIAVIFSNVCNDAAQSRSNKTGFIYFRGTDHNYHSIGDPLLGGECDTNESDHSSDTSKEMPTQELESVLVDDNILPYIPTLTENNQEPSSSLNESSVDSSTDFQLLEQCLIGNSLGREASPPLPQTITCDNLYQATLKQEVLEYDESSASNNMEFPQNSEVYTNQFQQQTMSVENMSELMNVVLTSIQNLNNMTRPTQSQDSPRQENLFQPVTDRSLAQNLEANCNFVPMSEPTNISFATDVSDTDFTNFYYLPVSYDSTSLNGNASNKKVIVERIPQYPEQATKPAVEISTVPTASIAAHQEVATTTISVQPAAATKKSDVTPVKRDATAIQISSNLPVCKVKQSDYARASSSLNLGFVRTSSRTRVSAPKQKKPSDSRKSVDERDSESNATEGSSSGAETEAVSPVKLKVREDLGVGNASLEHPAQSFKVVPAKGRSLYVIEDSSGVEVKKHRQVTADEAGCSTTGAKKLSNKPPAQEAHKQSKPREEDVPSVEVAKVELPRRSRTPKQTNEKPHNDTERPETVDLSAVKDLAQPKAEVYLEPSVQSDMIDNVKRRKRKPVDYSSIEKLLENDEESLRMTQKSRNKKEEADEAISRLKTKRKQEPLEEKQSKSKGKSSKSNDTEKSKAQTSDVESGNKSNSIFEDSDDDIPKTKKSKAEGRLEPEMMNALFDKLVDEGDINPIKTTTRSKSTREANASNGFENVHASSARTIPTTSIFNLETGLQKKSDSVTPVKQIGVVNPIPRPSNNLRKEPPCNNRNGYSGNEENRGSSQYYPYYPERSRRSYPYSSRESSRSSHQSSSRRAEYPSHSSDPRYSSQRSSSSSRSSRSSRHHSNSRSSTEQRSYRYTTATDLAWREDMKKKFPHMFKDEVFF